MLMPVLMSFFVMSFVDLVGIGVDRVSKDMNLSSTLGQLIPSAAFLWFLLLSVPVGIMQARIGKRIMLNIGMGITAMGMLVPFFIYSFGMVLFGFALLGIGNTIVQVSANPLLVDVVPGNRVSSFLSFSQFIKSIGSMVGAPLAAFFAAQYGDWKILFLVFGIVSMLSVLGSPASKSMNGSRKKYQGHSWLGIQTAWKRIHRADGAGDLHGRRDRCWIQFKLRPVPDPSITAWIRLPPNGRKFYFLGRMVGTFGGALLLTKLSSRKFLPGLLCWDIIALPGILFGFSSPFMAWVLVFIIGMAVANIFPLVFSLAVERHPNRTNEISGLMMMAIGGGAVIPLVMGCMSELVSVAAGMWVLVFCMIYLIGVRCIR